MLEEIEAPQCIATSKILADGQEFGVGAVIGNHNMGKQAETLSCLDGAHYGRNFGDYQLPMGAELIDAEVSNEYDAEDLLQPNSSSKLHLQLRDSPSRRRIKRVRFL